MKLIIQIPCFNEEKTLRQVIEDLPTEIHGISVIETQIIDDGSTDRTVEIAKELGVNHIIRFKNNKGLAAAFKAGVDNALEKEADILVNTDGDNQYSGADIAKLVRPIVCGEADMVIGCRPIADHPEFSPLKKVLQKAGSWTLRRLSGTNVRDAASGFRAYGREAMCHINIYSKFSYCMESLIQAGHFNLKIAAVDIAVNPKTRESRLFKNIFQYIWKSGKTMYAIFLLYRAGEFFNILAIGAQILSVSIFIRYLYLIFFASAPANAFWPTIILAGVLQAISFILYVSGIICSLQAANRKLSEEILYRLRKEDVSGKRDFS